MKISRILFYSFIFTMLYSCDDNKMEWGRDPAYGEITEDELPENEDGDDDFIVDENKGLKDYITDPNFKLGIGMGMDLFTYEDIYTELASTNFNDVAAGYSMKHDPMVTSTGEIQYSKLDDFFEMANEKSMSIFGHCLIWHSNQDRTWLKSVVKAAEEEGEDIPAEIILINTDFENVTSLSEAGWSIKAGHDNLVAEVVEEDGRKCLKIETLKECSNYWDIEISYTFPNDYLMKTEVDYSLTFDIKSTNSKKINTRVTNINGGSASWNTEYSPTTSWKTITNNKNYAANSGLKTDIAQLRIGFGKGVDTYYIDNIKLVAKNPTASTASTLSTDVLPDKATRVENAIKAEMQRWVSGMITYCYENAGVTCWDVVNEPMSDGDKDEIKSEAVDGGNNVPTDAFYWQDYFKKPREYAYWAFKYAREAFNELGVTDPKLFINDYGLENSSKLNGFIAYVNEFEALGCKVDGLATQMHITINQDKDKIREMLTAMAATNKLVKISELDIQVGDKESDHTAENFAKQAEMYEYVINTYFEVVPKAQQYGITIWSLSDNPVEHEYWLKGDAPNLWDAEYQPKEAYYSVAKALKKAFSSEVTDDTTEETIE